MKTRREWYDETFFLNVLGLLVCHTSEQLFEIRAKFNGNVDVHMAFCMAFSSSFELLTPAIAQELLFLSEGSITSHVMPLFKASIVEPLLTIVRYDLHAKNLPLYVQQTPVTEVEY